MSWNVPKVAECDANIDPMEFQVLVAMAEKQAVTAGGIMLPESSRDREEWGSDHARLLAVSPVAFTYANWPEGTRLPQVGDVVFLGKYPGDEVIGRDGRKYRLCSDREIKAVIERAPSSERARALQSSMRTIEDTRKAMSEAHNAY
jgi:co-chaperonin GroES (HSP10)